MLADFLTRFNRQFAVVPAQLNSAYRQLPPDLSLDSVLCFKYRRTVANDNTVRFNGAAIQILPNVRRSSYARATVEVQERLDGTILVVHQGRTLAAEPAPPGPLTLRARNGRRSNGLLPVNSTASGSTGPSFPLGALSDGTERRPPKETGTRPPLEKTTTDIITEQLH